MRTAIVLCLMLLAACGPQIGSLQKGESGRVAQVYNGDTLLLESGMRVFLAEVDAPSGKQPYANQARAELEGLALHRNVLLAYGGTRRWTPATQPDGAPRPETAIAQVFVQSEGGRWFWLQHALVSKGAAMVRPRYDNHARTPDLLAVEAQARAAQRGLWALRDYRALDARAATRAALAFKEACTHGGAPFRIVDAHVSEAHVGADRAELALQLANAQTPFSLVVFGDSFGHWSGPALDTLAGAHIRARGALGAHEDAAELCLDDSAELEILATP